MDDMTKLALLVIVVILAGIAAWGILYDRTIPVMYEAEYGPRD